MGHTTQIKNKYKRKFSKIFSSSGKCVRHTTQIQKKYKRKFSKIFSFSGKCVRHTTQIQKKYKKIQKKIQQNLFIFREMCSAHHTNTKEIQKNTKENSAKSFHLQGNVFGTPHK